MSERLVPPIRFLKDRAQIIRLGLCWHTITKGIDWHPEIPSPSSDPKLRNLKRLRLPASSTSNPNGHPSTLRMRYANIVDRGLTSLSPVYN